MCGRSENSGPRNIYGYNSAVTQYRFLGIRLVGANLELSPNTIQSYTVLPRPSVHLTPRSRQTTNIADLVRAQCKAPAGGIKIRISLYHCEESLL